MTGSIFPPLPPPLPKTAPLPASARKSMAAFGASPAHSYMQKAAPAATPATRKFGTALSNSATLSRAPSPVSSIRKAVVDRDAAARRYYHQYQYTPRHGIQKAFGASAARASRPERSSDKENDDPTYGVVDAPLSDEEQIGQQAVSAWDNYVHSAGVDGAGGRSIWSVTPEELAQLAVTLRASLNHSHRYHSMVFHKFHALPVIELTSTRNEPELELADTRESGQGCGTRAVLAPTKAKSLSAESPSFFPVENCSDDPTSELMQMLKTTLSSKKIAPHMDWWPGDWKCKKCGNHNFSYRETCKRCRVGRFEDAGFVYTPSSVRQSAAA